MELIQQENIENKIYTIRGYQVIFDRDLAKLYNVETKVFKQSVNRNIDRFPYDFMFELTKEELEKWRSQFVTSNSDKMGLRRSPYVFTEQGVSMLSAILKSKTAIDTSIQIIRIFTKMREFALNHKDILIKLQDMEKEIQLNQNQTNENTKHIKTAFELLSQILEDTTNSDKNLIGFAR